MKINKSIVLPQADYTETPDGLRVFVDENFPGSTLINIPHGPALAEDVQRAWRMGQSQRVVCLVPARTDAAWWHDYVLGGEIYFVRSRLTWGANRIPAALVVFDPKPSIPFGDVKKWELFKKTTKDHVCSGCGMLIRRGSICYRGNRIHNGQFVQVRICLSCTKELNTLQASKEEETKCLTE